MKQGKWTTDGKLDACKEHLTSTLSSISPGKCLRLREGVHKQLREREWLFQKVENDLVFLIHESGVFGIAVRTNDIDWNVL